MPKRSAAEAFAPGTKLSAFAAARARQQATEAGQRQTQHDLTLEGAGSGLDDGDSLDGSAADQVDDEDDDDDSTASDLAPSSRYAVDIAPRRRPLSRFQKQALQGRTEDGSQTWKLTLDVDEYVSCLGIYELEVEVGLVTVYGATIGPGRRSVIFAPATHALPTITSRAPGTQVLLQSRKWNSSSTSSPASLMLLQGLSPLWNRLWIYANGTSLRLIHSGEDTNDLRYLTALDVEDGLQQTLNRLGNVKHKGKPPSHILVAGAKGVGKSSFCRLLLNTILTSPGRPPGSTCFWMDLDPGQPEFGLPGQISLVQIREPIFGPSMTHAFTHSNLSCRTIRSHFLGAISPVENSEHYVHCALSLLEFYGQSKKAHPGAPLIINSCGWSSGSGANLVARIIGAGHIDQVVLLESPLATSSELASTLASAESTANVASLFTEPRVVAGKAAGELRAMQAMSYFHSTLTDETSTVWIGRPLSSIGSIAVPYTGPGAAIDGIATYHDHVEPKHLSMILDGMPVGLVVVTSLNAFATSGTIMDEPFRIVRTPGGLPFVISSAQSASTVLPCLDPVHSHCLGQALISRVDAVKGELHLRTPVTMADIEQALAQLPPGKPSGGRAKKVNGQPGPSSFKPMLILVRGRLDSPDWSFTEHFHWRDAARRRDKLKNLEGDEMDSARSALYPLGTAIRAGADFDLSPPSSDDEDDGVGRDVSGIEALVAAAGLEGEEAERTKSALSMPSPSHPHISGLARLRSEHGHGTNATETPYVDIVPRLPRSEENGGVSGSDREVAVVGAALSGKVWRPRYLPRNR